MLLLLLLLLRELSMAPCCLPLLLLPKLVLLLVHLQLLFVVPVWVLAGQVAARMLLAHCMLLFSRAPGLVAVPVHGPLL